MTDVQGKDKPAAKTTARKDAQAFAALEMPSAMREMAEKGVKQAKDAYESYKAIAEDATDSLEDTFATFTKGSTEFQSKAIRAAKANVDASFDHIEKLVGAKSLSEVIELQTAFVRHQFDALSDQTKDFQVLASKLQADSARPLSDGVSKAMAQWKQAS